MIKIALLTSTRADYSIYYPLLKLLASDERFSLSIVAFGTHLSEAHGYTVQQILNDGFEVAHCMDTLPEGDSPADISAAMGKTMSEFAKLWATIEVDKVICLGDRFEMFAAAAAAVPFGKYLVHIHGGETTTGAIDDAFRHSITHFSSMHFAAAEPYRQRIIELKGSNKDVYDTGSLSIDNLENLELMDTAAFAAKFGYSLDDPTALITFHPETVSFHRNEYFIDQLLDALRETPQYPVLFTMPNNDTSGSIIRKKITEFVEENPRAKAVELLGTVGYLTAMKHCAFMIGNTSSGFIEASFFGKPVINLGDRQNGRIRTPNITDCKIEKNEIKEAIEAVKGDFPSASAIYGNGHAASNMIQLLAK